MGLTVLRRSGYKTVPWKNGGGITHEVLRSPENEAVYQWRVSLAEIDRPGPFSSFAGYQRHMALVKGRGVRLKFGDGRHVELNRAGDLVHFDGGISVECDLIEGSCLDLNLIAANHLAVDALVGPAASGGEVPEGMTQLFMPLMLPLEMRSGAGPWQRLDPLDLGLLVGPAGLDLRVLDAQGSTPAPVFFATISHGRQS
jgi:hypothetical protein